MERPSIVGICNPLLDYANEFDDAFYNEYQLAAGSACLYDDKIHKDIFVKMKAKPGTQYVPGGAAQNSMRTAAALSKTPGYVAFVGCVGKDEDAKIMQELNNSVGLISKYMETDKDSTGACACIVHHKSKDRTMVTRLGAAIHFSADYLTTIWPIIENAKIILTSGFLASSSPETLIKIAEYCAPRVNKLWAVGLNAEFIIEVYKSNVKHWLEYANLIVGNDDEWRAWGRSVGLNDSTLPEIVKNAVETPGWKCNEKKPRMMIATCGSMPTVVAYKMEASDEARVEEFAVQKVPPELIVDTIGCGDSFIGGFLYGWSKHYRLDKCVEIGHLCASEVLKNSGCTCDLRSYRDALNEN